MAEFITLDNLKEHLAFFEKMYDWVRIVDPLHKNVISYIDNTITETDEICYKYWKAERICDNCVSIRAFRENKTFIKLEQTRSLILMLTAIPVQIKECPVVLELLKNATDTMLIGSENTIRANRSITW